jgi:hypothetical protein
MRLNSGDRAKILKRTFLHQGIFVHTNSVVVVKDVSSDSIIATYIDKEGYPHDISFLPEELELISQ